MAKKPSEPMVLLPYSDLMGLLDASKLIKELNQNVKRLEAQQAALRGMFLELMDRFRELEI